MENENEMSTDSEPETEVLEHSQASGSSSSTPVVRSSSGTSLVWKFFQKTSTHGICQTCNAKIKLFGGSTTTMLRHLTNSHKELLEKEKAANQDQAKQLTLFEVFKKSGTLLNFYMATLNLNLIKILEPYSPQINENIGKVVVEMLCKDLVPFTTVENEGFRKLIKAINPKIVLPSRATIRNKLLPGIQDYNSLIQTPPMQTESLKLLFFIY